MGTPRLDALSAWPGFAFARKKGPGSEEIWCRCTKSQISFTPLTPVRPSRSLSDATLLTRSSLAWYHFRIFNPFDTARFFATNLRTRLRQKHQHHAVAAEEEFADEAVAVDGLALLSVCVPGSLAPHLLHVLQDHVAVTIESLDTCEQFSVVAGGNEDLGVVAHGGLKERKRAGCELVGFEEGELVFAATRCE